jgi:hypothetical protein
MALNFSDACLRKAMNRVELVQSGKYYIDLLEDLDVFLSKSKAFRLAYWIESAIHLAEVDSAGGVQLDCFSPILFNNSRHDNGCCLRFFEWNARCQITTWNPTPSDAAKVPGGPIDYAAKHWSGLVKQYYAERARILFEQALYDQEHQQELNQTEVQRLFAKHAFEWTTSNSFRVSTEPVSSNSDYLLDQAIIASEKMLHKYSSWFGPCDKIQLDASESSTKW